VTTTVDLLDAIRTHLTEFELPELYSINATKSLSGPNVTAQLACHTLPQIADALLAWADTLTDATVKAWRPPRGDTVHLSVIGLLTSGISVAVYGGVDFTDHSIGNDLAPDASTIVPLTVLRQRATFGEVAL
jgi:hypothetical protein